MRVVDSGMLPQVLTKQWRSQCSVGHHVAVFALHVIDAWNATTTTLQALCIKQAGKRGFSIPQTTDITKCHVMMMMWVA